MLAWLAMSVNTIQADIGAKCLIIAFFTSLDDLYKWNDVELHGPQADPHETIDVAANVNAYLDLISAMRPGLAGSMATHSPASYTRRAQRAAAVCLVLGALSSRIWATPDAPRVPAIEAAADLVLFNGTIYTMHEQQPRVQAVAVSAGRILYAGANEKARSLAGAHAHLIDLHGKAMLPGLIDSHIHPALGEFVDHRLCKVRAYTLPDVYSKVAHCAATAPPGDWAVAYGLDSTGNPEFASITHSQLDALVSDRKLAVVSLDMHTV